LLKKTNFLPIISMKISNSSDKHKKMPKKLQDSKNPCTFAPLFPKRGSDGGIAQLVRAHDS
jgi:hypothetical protein